MLTDLLANLPPHLAERTRVHQSADSLTGNAVVYWMRTALRTDENPALDAARWLAGQLHLPLFVYQGLSERYPYASDRHHRFILEGARDVQRQCQELGIPFGFWLESGGTDQRPLAALADAAAVVITEEMPTRPPRRFLDGLVRRTSTPILCVDTACVVPMRLVSKPYTRAFQFRGATQKLYEERVGRDWPDVEGPSPLPATISLPFEPVDLWEADLDELIAGCDIDHAVGPVPDTTGGSVAGYRRWNEFCEKGLSQYARRRNDPLVDGNSRMSAYLHYGMVSPMRMAREASEFRHGGSEKYLDELLIWREMAYAFCFHRPDHDQWTALPDWARETLETHAKDPRPVTYSWEQLARAQTDDPLWNTAQLSLLRQGELHNNVRMTWGKAILNWTKDPQRAFEWMVDLNHRYALDGRDPASYGGLLWCLGQFDRPFSPAREILGTVRERPLTQHAARLDVAAWRKKVASPRYASVPRVAVIGAGISGLFAARTLADHGLPVQIFEKSRGTGGRMASRRVDQVPSFDHGAQYFTARHPIFRRYLESWQEQGRVARWPDPDTEPSQTIVTLPDGHPILSRGENERFVGVPAMNSICKHLAEGLPLQTRTRIVDIRSGEAGLSLIDDAGQEWEGFDRLVVSAPAEQSAELLSRFPELAEPISKIPMHPCWAAMVTLPRPLTVDWVGAFLNDSFLSWAARNGTKPGRPNDREFLILHAHPEWTEENWERDPIEVAREMLAEFCRVASIATPPDAELQGHRWKYALPEKTTTPRCFWSHSNGIAVCGDWCGGSRIEGAFLSGMAAAGRILGSLPQAAEGTIQKRLFAVE